MIAKVAIPIPYADPFDYLVPESFLNRLALGTRVVVPLGPRHIIGTIVELTEYSTVEKLKAVVDIVDEKPVYSPPMLDFTKWIAGYYLCSWAETLEAALPGGMKPKIKQYIQRSQNTELISQLEESEKKWISELGDKPASVLSSPQWKNKKKQINRLKKQGVLLLKPKIEGKDHLRPEIETLYLLEEKNETAKIREGTKAFKLIEYLKSCDGVTESQIKKEISGITPVIKKLIGQGVIARRNIQGIKTKPRPQINDERFLQLHPQQEEVFSSIQGSINKKVYQTFLLHGITGSGKTEIYLHAVREALKLNRTCLILIPEISLTPQAVSRFEERFGSRIAVLHSGLNDKERAAEWWKIREKECDIVIGARSAIFAPLENIGLIVVDEEHDTSYKQQETPYYNARDAAVKLAADMNATVILGSATPAVESYYNSSKNKYNLRELKHRANLKPLPDVDIINLKNEKRQKGAFYLSAVLVETLKQTLAKDQQCLVFLNRRGFASFLSCKECELAVLCRNCSIAMTWHKNKKRLICHHCGETRNYPSRCESCGESSFRMEGIGTQRVEQDLSRLFPEARFLRMDRDSIQKKGTLEKSIKKINDREVDFVIGTQLISKGHDFKHIGVVCIILADMSLNFPDFRSSERSFQIISQVSGRAGRDEKGEGITVIQTYNPDHFAIQTAIKNDYLGFYQQEMELRKDLANPPICRQILLKISSLNPEHARETAVNLGNSIKEKRSNAEFQILGPVEAPIQKINQRFYWHILLKAENPSGMRQLVKRLFWNRADFQIVGATRINIDVDPYMLM